MSATNTILQFLNPARTNDSLIPIVLVAVHGLNPLDKESHAEATWTVDGKLWLRDFLPKRVPGARILLFGYNANVAIHTTTAGVWEEASNLLNRLEGLRERDPGRPLIFICHSLGGIIVKRALVHSSSDSLYRNINKSTYGIVFFGTPHNGGAYAEIGHQIAKFCRYILRNPSNTFMHALKKNSVFLDSITGDFRHQLEKLEIISFYETQPLSYLGI
ncbi:Alpha/Beta hydrolase protein [Annulohypoxylon bovei var. microspora]|nr:Alpha/Beta hydrolase protein [Annulohypoxylon bovei var. microspora]